MTKFMYRIYQFKKINLESNHYKRKNSLLPYWTVVPLIIKAPQLVENHTKVVSIKSASARSFRYSFLLISTAPMLPVASVTIWQSSNL